MNLSKLNDKQLNTLLTDIQKEIKTRSAQTKAQKELDALAKKYGAATIKKLASSTKATRTRKKSGKVAPIYRNPDNHQQTWTGRGRSPAWVAEAEKNHGGREALKISNQ